MLYSIQLISIHVLKALGCFSVLPRENNGTDRDTLSLDIVNFREVIFFHDGSFVSRDVRLLDSFISGFRAFTVEFSSGSRRGAWGRGAGSPLYLDQNETRKVHPPLPALLKVWIHHWNVCIHLCVNKYQCAPCIGFTVSKGKKYKVCRLLRSSGNRLRMSLNNYSEICVSPPSPSQCHKPPGRLCSIIPLGFTQEEKRK